MSSSSDIHLSSNQSLRDIISCVLVPWLPVIREGGHKIEGLWKETAEWFEWGGRVFLPLQSLRRSRRHWEEQSGRGPCSSPKKSPGWHLDQPNNNTYATHDMLFRRTLCCSIGGVLGEGSLWVQHSPSQRNTLLIVKHRDVANITEFHGKTLTTKKLQNLYLVNVKVVLPIFCRDMVKNESYDEKRTCLRQYNDIIRPWHDAYCHLRTQPKKYGIHGMHWTPSSSQALLNSYTLKIQSKCGALLSKWLDSEE